MKRFSEGKKFFFPVKYGGNGPDDRNRIFFFTVTAVRNSIDHSSIRMDLGRLVPSNFDKFLWFLMFLSPRPGTHVFLFVSVVFFPFLLYVVSEITV